MKVTKRFPLSAATVLAVVFFCAVATPSIRADPGTNPTSKFFVAEVDGTATYNDGDKLDDLTNKTVHTAQGTTIETKAKSSNAMVMSNGVGVFLGPDTRAEYNKFTQEPFSASRNDPEVEPSVSQTACSVPHGSVGLCTSKMVAGSNMVYNTPNASINIRGRKVAIQTSDNTTVVSAIEGEVTVRGDQLTGGENLKPGQQAIITRTSPTSPPQITIQPIPDNQKAAINDMVDSACAARKTVYFEEAKSKDNVFTKDPNPPEIVVKQVVQPTVNPVIVQSGGVIF